MAWIWSRLFFFFSKRKGVGVDSRLVRVLPEMEGSTSNESRLHAFPIEPKGHVVPIIQCNKNVRALDDVHVPTPTAGPAGAPI
jgi:hypothetical protein